MQRLCDDSSIRAQERRLRAAGGEWRMRRRTRGSPACRWMSFVAARDQGGDKRRERDGAALCREAARLPEELHVAASGLPACCGKPAVCTYACRSFVCGPPALDTTRDDRHSSFGRACSLASTAHSLQGAAYACRVERGGFAAVLRQLRRFSPRPRPARVHPPLLPAVHQALTRLHHMRSAAV